MTIITLHLGDFTLAALGYRNGHGQEELIPARMVHAIRYYLADKERGRPEWKFPALPPGDATAHGIKLELSIDDSLWRSLEDEAADQGVTPEQLAVHAALYYAADRDAGRVNRD